MSGITENRPRKELWFWRIAFVSTIGFLVFSHNNQRNTDDIKEDCLIQTSFYGEIAYDGDVIDRIAELRDNTHVKGVLLQVNSPGGEVTASESLYRAFKSLKDKKPLIVSVQSAAASGGYMLAMSADKIFAYESSAVGSIGVIAYGFEVTDLADKLGVKLLNYKSSPLKGIPNLFEKTSPEADRSIQNFVTEMNDIFQVMVKNSRPSITNFEKICNGEIYSGRQGVTNGLVDAIGTESDALSELKAKTSDKLKIVDYDLIYESRNSIGFFSHAKKIIKAIAALI